MFRTCQLSASHCRTIVWLVCCAFASYAKADDAADFFESNIRPVLIEHCYECHAGEADLIQGGLRLDHPDGMARGGDSGAAVMPGQPDKSLLLTAIRYDELEMPPSGPLDQKVVRDFERWIELGAVDPRQADPLLPLEDSQQIDWDEAKRFWSFQPPRAYPPPMTNRDGWCSRKIDTFVLSRLEQNGLTPSPPASRATLIRRLSFDLTGLPPLPDDVRAYVNDDRPDATRRVVERLLASPAGAERWRDFGLTSSVSPKTKPTKSATTPRSRTRMRTCTAIGS